MHEKKQILTLKETVAQAQQDGIRITEYSLRRMVKSGVIPVRFVGPKTLVPYAAFVRYMLCEDGADNAPVIEAVTPCIRPVEL